MSFSRNKCRVLFEDEAGTLKEIVVRFSMKDKAAFEQYAARKNWRVDGSTFLFAGFVAWSALKRSPDAPQILKTKTFEEFFDVADDVLPYEVEDEEEEASLYTSAAL